MIATSEDEADVAVAGGAGTLPLVPMLVIGRSGDGRVVEAGVGTSLMEEIRAAGFLELRAICNGCCSCATCHVKVGGEAAGRLPPMGEEERELLAESENRTARSRLSCQITVTQEMAGLTVTVAPED